MVQLGNTNQESTGFTSLIVSLCLLSGMVFALLGIKFPWFKRRLTINQNVTRNGTTGDSRSGSVAIQGGASENYSKDKVLPEGTEINGVFRKRQEDEWDLERPVVLPPIVSKSLSNLKLETQTSVQHITGESPTLPPGNIAPRRKRKEKQRLFFEKFPPPTHLPPRPPIPPIEDVTQDTQKQQQFEGTDFEEKLVVVAAKLEEFAAQFEKVEKSHEHNETNSPLPIQNRLSFIDQQPITSVAGDVKARNRSLVEESPQLINVETMTLNEDPGTSSFEGFLPTDPTKLQDYNESDTAFRKQDTTINSANGRGKRNSFLSIEPDKFKDINEEDTIVRLREIKVNSANGLDKLHSFVPIQPDKLRETTINSANGQGNRNSFFLIEPDKFKDLNEEDAIVRLRETTINPANGRGKRNSFLSIEPEKFKDSDELDYKLRETSVNFAEGRGKRNSYVKYEEVDKIDEEIDYFLNKWDTLALNNFSLGHTFEENANGFNYKSSSLVSIFEPPNTLDRFENLKHENIERSVEHLWLKIEEHNSNQAQYTEFRQNRHSTESHEADILADSSLEFTELEKVVSTPTGYGKNIDEDWENFENLSVMASTEQIFEPRMEQIDTTLNEKNMGAFNLEIEHLTFEPPTCTPLGKLEIKINKYNG